MAKHEGASFADGEAQAALREWWEELDQDRGDRAQLRRCRNPSDVAFCPAYHRLCRTLPTFDRERLAMVAGLLAHVEEDVQGSLAQRMATPKTSGGNARVSGLRFRRLLGIPDGERDKLYEQMVRVVRMLDRGVNMRDLATSVFWWNHGTRKEWARKYYEQAPSEK